MSPYMQSAFDDWFEEACEESNEVDMKRLKVDLKSAFAAGVRTAAEYAATYLPQEVA